MPVSEMLHRMSSRELTEWAAYFQVEHEDAQDRRAKSPGADASDVYGSLYRRWQQRRR